MVYKKKFEIHSIFNSVSILNVRKYYCCFEIRAEKLNDSDFSHINSRFEISHEYEFKTNYQKSYKIKTKKQSQYINQLLHNNLSNYKYYIYMKVKKKIKIKIIQSAINFEKKKKA